VKHRAWGRHSDENDHQPEDKLRHLERRYWQVHPDTRPLLSRSAPPTMPIRVVVL